MFIIEYSFTAYTINEYSLTAERVLELRWWLSRGRICPMGDKLRP